MDNTVFTKAFSEPPVNIQEIRRYSGIEKTACDLDDVINACLSEAKGIFTYKVCYRIMNVQICGNRVDFGSFQIESADLAKCLGGSTKAVVFALTVGMGIDRLIHKYSLVSPSKSVIFQGIGAERAESLCNMFNEEIKGRFMDITPRFSPGYGDFSLEHQRDIFRVLEAGKNIGLALGENFLMSPSKSVTGVIGIK